MRAIMDFVLSVSSISIVAVSGGRTMAGILSGILCTK